MIKKKGKPIQTGKEIAVIGMAGRFPGAGMIDEFWQNLKNGVESISFFTGRELEEAGVDPQMVKHPNYVKAKGIFENKEYFDAGFFGYTPLEAEIMNPQVRIFHEFAWEALENAGYEPGSYNGSIGLYAGAGSSSYWEALVHMSGKSSEIGGFAAGHLNNKDFINARISYNLNLNGPVFSLYTACSTSLVAIHLACRGLLMGECNMALAGGITISAFPGQGYLYQPEMIASPDGHCRAFDAKAMGVISGEGGGLVLLKHLKKAIADGDYIYAVVKGSAINNDGNQKVGFTAPSLKSQAEVIQTAQRIARVEPGTIGYIEAHGTGTTLGDPVEIKALTLAFTTGKHRFCAIGSVKTNIGHLDTGAGVASFIKTVLALKHRLIPPSLHFQSPNPGIDFENSPFYVNTKLKQWNNNGVPLRAGVTSLGIGGTNAHVVLEESPIAQSAERQALSAGREYQLILLSAKTGSALDKMTNNLKEYFIKSTLNHGNHENPINPGQILADAAYTLQVGRKSFSYRKMLVCPGVNEAIESLSIPGSGKVHTLLTNKDKRPLIFMFPGQGSQYVNMGLGLYKTEPVFREEMDCCFKILQPLMGYDIKEILYPSLSVSSVTSVAKKIDQTEIAQPLLFVFEYALAKLLMRWGIEPYAMIGHSIGEYVAAHLSGVFSMEDALKLVALRGRLMQQMPAGSMLSVPLDEDALMPFLDNELSIAAVNTSSGCVVSGAKPKISKLARQLKEKGYETRLLHTSHAFHSPMMEPILEKFAVEVKKIKLNRPEIPYISNLTGNWITAAEAMDPTYWTTHLRRTVRFARGISNLIKKEHAIFVEIGAGKTLSTLVRQHADKTNQHEVINIVRHPGESMSDIYYLLNQVGKLWLYGINLDWKKFYNGEKRYRIPLPTYPFEGSRYWYENDLFKRGLQKLAGKSSSFKKPDMADWFYVPLWEQGIPEPPHFQESLTWLVFINEQEFAAKLVDHLVRNRQHVVIVKAGTKFTSDIKSVGTCIINPRKPGDYDSLFKELRQLNRIPQKILHLWNITGEDTRRSGLEELDSLQDLGLFSLLNIVQATGRLDITDQIQIEVLTDHMLKVTGDEQLCPAKATMLGAVKIIPLEYPNIKCRGLDIVVPGPGSRRESKLLHHLLGEFTANSKDKFVAYRGDQRWIRIYKPHRLEETNEAKQQFKEKGVYLIIGGFGGMGFTITEYLANTFKARLILVGRSVFPPREKWGQLRRIPGPQDDTVIKIKKILEWEERGAEIMVVNADVSNLEQMQEAISRVNHKFHRVNGVIHAAGVVDYGGVIQKRTRKVTDKYMASKVRGTLVLEELFKDAKLDFLVLFSSTGNVIYKGKFGQVSYNAANEFLEAFSDYKFLQDGVFTTTINWDDWREVGMSVMSIKRQYKNKTGKLDWESLLDGALFPSEGVEVFTRIMESHLHRVTVSTIDLGAKLQKQEKDLEKTVGETLMEKIEKTRGTSDKYLYRRPGLSTAYAAPGNEMEIALTEIWQRLSGIEKVGIYDDFFELGGDSLKAMTIIANIHKTLQIRVPLTVFFNNPTIKGIVQYIDNVDRDVFSPIKPLEKKEYYPLSSAQKRLYILNNLEEESITYNQPQFYQLDQFNVMGLKETLKKMIQRHDSLRTSFELVNEEPVQKIHDHVEFSIEYNEPLCSTDNDPGSKKSLIQGVKRFVRPFDLSKVPIFRIGLLKIEENRYLYMQDIHHIISDGSGNGIFVSDLMAFYNNQELPSLKIQYKDFSEWQNSEKQLKEIKEMEEYWLKEFQGEVPVLNLPTDYTRPASQRFEGSSIDFEISHEHTEALRLFALNKEATLYMILLTIYSILLSKISSQETLVIGSPIAARNHVDLQRIIGMFANTLVLMNHPKGEKTFLAFLEEVKEKTLKAFENQDFQFENLVDKVVVNRDMSRNPLFDTMFVFQNIAVTRLGISSSNLKSLKYENPTAKFDLTLEAAEVYDRLSLKFEYCTLLFKKETIERFIAFFNTLIASIIKNPGIKISDIEIISEEEKEKILSNFNDTDAEYPQNKTIHELFEEQVKRTPDNIAVVGESHELHELYKTASSEGTGGLAALTLLMSITYKELNEKSNHLAYLLQTKNVKTDTIVGIMVERSLEMIIGIVGILKVGSAYLPIDPDYPEKRIQHMLVDSGAKVLLTTSTLAEKWKKVGRWEGKKILISSTLPCCHPSPLQPFYSSKSSNLVYVLYTSGTTGKPKGVILEHQNLVNLLFWGFKFTNLDFSCVLQYANIGFDASFHEIFSTLLSGGKLCLINEEIRTHISALFSVIEKNRIRTVFLPISLLKVIFSELNFAEMFPGCVRHIQTAGEQVVVSERFRSHLQVNNIYLHNHYGPTETHVVTALTMEPGGQIPEKPSIGTPISNITILILDKNQNLQPVGISGELYVGGHGLARGYLNLPELTAEKFVSVSFVSSVATIYKTGDLAKWLPDGNIDFLGRVDHQVKIRGFRVELGEIECHLLNYNEIKEAVVIAKEDKNGNIYLCAYMVSDKEFTVTELRSYLSKCLPDYMLPSYFIPLKKIPLTSNGKVDRNGLPEPGAMNLSSDMVYIEPRNIIEKKLAEIWQKVLGINAVSINDNFFEIGGDSIKTIQIVSRMKKAGYKFEMRDIFKHQQILDLAPFVKKVERIADQSVITGTIPLTPIQKRFFENQIIDRNHYNQAMMIILEEGFDVVAAKAVFTKIHGHHDALRMIFKKSDEGIIQLNQGPKHLLSLQVFDYRNHESASDLIESRANEIQSSIDLEIGPLMKLGLFHLEEGDRLLIVIHHLVIDSVSWRILLGDIDTLYQQYRKSEPLALPLKTDSFKVWSEKLSEYAKSDLFFKEKTYWTELESTQVQEIKKDFEDGHNYIIDVDTSSFTLKEEETNLLLTKVNGAFGTGIDDILLTALGLAIKRVYGNDRLLIALEGEGREKIVEDVDVSRTVGWFSSLYPVLLDFSYESGKTGDRNLARQIKEVKESLRRVPNKGVGYGILRYLIPGENREGIGSRIKPQVIFNYLGQFNEDQEHFSFSIAKESAGYYRSPNEQREFEIEVSGMITDKRLTMSISYSMKQYKRETMEKLLNHFKKELKHMVTYCSSREAKELTPSDLTYPEISIEALDRLQEQYSYLIEDIYPLTPLQEGMLFYTLYEDKNRPLYFQQMSSQWQGELNISFFKKTIQELFKRHDIFRTVFIYEGLKRPLQVVLKERNVEFYFEDLQESFPTPGEKERFIREFREKDRQRSFDLSKDVLMRVAVFQLEDSKYQITWSSYHILMDGWCMGILLSEFSEIFDSFMENRAFQLPSVKPYRTYIQWLEKQEKNKTKNYWKKYLEGYEEIAAVPRKENKGTFEGGYKAAAVFTRFEENKTTALNKVAIRNRVTLNTVIQAVWGIVLGKYNSKQDVVFGMLVSGRSSEVEGIDSMVGCFINTIPVRITFDQNMKFNELLRIVQDRAIESEPFHYFSLAEIQSESTLKQNLLDHIIQFQNFPITERVESVGDDISGDEKTGRVDGAADDIKMNDHAETLELADVNVFEQGGDYSFYITIVPQDQIDLGFSYNANLYDEDMVEQIGFNCIRVLEQIIENDNITIGEIAVLSEEERRKILFEFNNNKADFPRDKTIYQFVENHAEITPDRIAIVSSMQLAVGKEEHRDQGVVTRFIASATYRDLNERANQLAIVLRSSGIKKDEPVGILMERSLQMVESILAVWKAGGAYMPIDPDYPVERIDHMLSNSKAKVLVTTPGLSEKYEKLSIVNCQLLMVNETPPNRQRLNNPPKEADSINNYQLTINNLQLEQTSLAYIIYTSGSTGKPKGVMIEHMSMMNHIQAKINDLQLTEESIVAQNAAHTFDISVWQFFAALTLGGKVVVYPREVILDPEKFISRLVRDHVTILEVVPSYLTVLLEYARNLRIRWLPLHYLLVTGEEIKLPLVKKWFGRYPGIKMVNAYGPTEASDDITHYIMDKTPDMKRIPIGKPLQNLNIYIVDNRMQLCPIGVKGEICVSGVGVGRGYLGDDEKTKQFFMENPFASSITNDQCPMTNDSSPKLPPNDQFPSPHSPHSPYSPHSTIYRTGDLGAWQPDGNIEFFGRKDYQVKIRGFRIEIGEIENELLAHDEIKEAVVVTKEAPNGDIYLCAYLISEKELTTPALRSYLSKNLPDYMLPSYFIPLSEIPLTPNGKVDRERLPEPGPTALSSYTAYVAPRNKKEKILTEIWQQVLGKNAVSINDNFFDIGGNSINTIQIVSRMKKAGYKVEMRDIFRYPRISELAPLVRKIERIADQSVITGAVPLTPIQKKFFEHRWTTPHHFNQAVILFFEQGVEEEVVQLVFSKLQEHHDALRMIYKKENGKTIQVNQGLDHPLLLQVFDYRSRKETNVLVKSKANEIQASIDLETGPLMKLGLFHSEDGDRLLIVIHHLVIDGVSWRILFEDIETLYRQYSNGEPLVLPLKTDSFKVWSEKLSGYADDDLFLKEKTYWAQLESKPIQEIKKDFESENNQMKDFETLSFTLNEKETALLLTEVNEAFGTGINDILLTALGLAIKKVYGNDRLLIALKGQGRKNILKDVDVRRTVGWFTALYPVLLDFSHESGERENNLSRQIKEVKESLRRVPNKGVGYGILEYLTAEKNKEGINFTLNPQVIFNYLEQFDDDSKHRSFKITQESTGYTRSPDERRSFEIEVSGMITDKRLSISISYSKKQYKRETIKKLADYFKKELNHLISYCISKDKKELTPSDFTYPGISIDTLDQLQKQNLYLIEDIYPLTPMQEGMLFYTLYEDKNRPLYFLQMYYRFQGEYNISLAERSLNELFKRHDILRTVFIHENLDRPLQVVLKERNVDFYYQDLRAAISDSQSKERLVLQFKEKDRQRSFDLSKDVLMRVSVLQSGDMEYQVTWSSHHILMDGWCMGILISEFLEIYNSFIENRPVQLPPVKPYRNYIQWIEKQGKNKTKNYWRNYLEDYEEIAAVPRKQGKGTFAGGYKAAGVSTSFDEEKTILLNRVAMLNNVTLNTLIQTVWAIVLGQYTSKQDVVFGMLVSGRPSELEGVEAMVGCFINTIPVRITYDQNMRFTKLLRIVQDRAIESEPHHYFSLAEIQAGSALKQNLLDHLVSFQNLPMVQRLEGVWDNITGNEKNERIGGMEDNLRKKKKNRSTGDVGDTKKIEKAKTMNLSNLNAFEQGGDYNFYVTIIPHDQIYLSLSYNANLYDRELVEQLGINCIRVLEQIIENEDIAIGEIVLLSGEERRKILFEFNNNKADFPRDKTIYQFVEKHAEITPDHVALIGQIPKGVAPPAYKKSQIPNKEAPFGQVLNAFGGGHLTYRELNERANRLARALSGSGIQKDETVGILMERSQFMVESILAIWKAGGAYLSIDPGYPEERIDHMLSDSKAKVLLTTSGLSEKYEKSSIINCQLLMVNEIPPHSRRLNNPPKGANSINNYQLTINNSQLDQTSLAYIIYTSGSTGKPKGVMIEHIGMMNHIQAKINDLQLTERSIVAQNATHTFDISIWQFFAALTFGGQTVIYPDELIMEPGRFLSRLVKDQITILEVVPSYLSVLLDYIDNQGTLPFYLQYLLVTGEEIKPHMVKKWFDKYPHIKMVNAYGPTEAADDITHHIMDKAPNMERIPIGKPLQNMNIYIVDNRMQLCPIGVKGEICVSGVGVGRGYIGDQQKTKQCFIENPFVSPITDESSPSFTNDQCPMTNDSSSKLSTNDRSHKLYLTGDLGAWLPDGTILFFGRKDYQVKIRGFRIELGEIENQLVNHKEIKEAVVIDREDKTGNKYLCAYIVVQRMAHGAWREELREFLSKTLPNYMVPAHFLQLDKIPITSSGKLDRKALPEPEGDEIISKYVAPGNHLEKKLVEIWAKVLGKEEEGIGIHHNFFDLGGHSLNAIVLAAKVHKEFDVKVPLAEFFKTPTISELSHYIKESVKNKYASIGQVEKRDYYTLSSAQKRLYILQQMDLKSTVYNMSQVITLPGEPHIKKLEKTFIELINRHESLRTSFQMVNHEPVQKIHDTVEFKIEYYEKLVSGLWSLDIGQEDHPHLPHSPHSNYSTRDIIRHFSSAFDLSRAPLLKVGVVKADEEKYVLVVVMHHIISDGVSHMILRNDFMALYQGKELPTLRIQYKDFSEWQNKEKQKEYIKEQERYWLRQFEGKIPELDLPTDYPRPQVQLFKGSIFNDEISCNTDTLRTIAAENGATTFMVLLAIFNIFLSKVCGQEDIVVGTPVVGRKHVDLARIMGLFVNSLALRNSPNGEKTFLEFLKEVRERTLEAFDNQDYQFEDLVEKLALERVRHNPIFDVMFICQDQGTGGTGGTDVTGKRTREEPKKEPRDARENQPSNENEPGTSKFDLTTNIVISKKLQFSFRYSTELFKEQTIEILTTGFKEVVLAVLEDRNIKLKDISLAAALPDTEVEGMQEIAEMEF